MRSAHPNSGGLQETLQYADDYAVMALSELELQEIVTVFSDPYFKFGLSVNCKKIQLLYQGPPNGTAAVPPIRDCGKPLEVVDNFPYLGSIISRKMTIDSEVQHRTQ